MTTYTDLATQNYGLTASKLDTDDALNKGNANILLGDNLCQVDNRFDVNTTNLGLNKAGQFNVASGNITSSLSGDAVALTINADGLHILENSNIINDITLGENVYISLWVKFSRVESIHTLEIGVTTSTTDSYLINSSTEWKYYEFYKPKTAASQNRIAFYLNNTLIDDVVEIKDLKISSTPFHKSKINDFESRIQNVEKNKDDLYYLAGDNYLSAQKRFDINTTIESNIITGWNQEQGLAVFSKLNDFIEIDTDSQTAGNFLLSNSDTLNDVQSGDTVVVSFKAKRIIGTQPIYIGIESLAENDYVIPMTSEWQNFTFTKIKLSTGTYLNRIAFIIDAVSTRNVFQIKDITISSNNEVLGKAKILENKTIDLQNQINTLGSFVNNVFTGLKVSIGGDSISTAVDFNAYELTILDSDLGSTVSAYVTYHDVQAGLTIGGYTVQESDIGNEVTFTPVLEDVGKKIGMPKNYNSLNKTQTWWGLLASRLGMDVLQNVSWSGSSVTSHENEGEYVGSYLWHPSQIRKFASRDVDGNTVTPDIIILYRGTNDFSHTPYAKLTDFNASLTEVPDTDIVETTNYGYKEALSITIEKIRESYPNAYIVLCTLNIFKRGIYDHFPVRNGVHTLPEFNNAIREVADIFGCGLIEFDKSGITFENCYPDYISDSETTPTHPNATGHLKMANRAITDLKKCYN